MSIVLAKVAIVALALFAPADGQGNQGGAPCGTLQGIGCVLGGEAPVKAVPTHGSSKGTCGPWKRIVQPGVDNTALASYTDVRDGVVFIEYWRDCKADFGDHLEYGWFRDADGRELGAAAYDSVRRLVPQPEVTMSRKPDQLIVNVETSISVTPIPLVTATAEIPGLAATVTATPVRIDIVTGSHVTTDVQRISCPPWGGAGCVWTPIYPSVTKVTGTNDHRHHGSVSIVWDVAWTATDGTGGPLDQLTTTTPMEFAVREIQIIGGA